ncbi:GGDEF domain-containing protein [uncultured Ferrovibrio sp.]|jgi:diguanylate cyclase (GGDEF)-like protein|uniref:GGDEF domain-containing protein n=1 Tax=uncultured Ferrovibrio sp. TaxID=1576913 RepID=UPI00261AD8F2|nr:GGDEF domain-containing protein [uncultured Ferrovibrio sp.]
MTFDMGTAVFFIGLQAVLAALALGAAWRIHHHERAATYWALGYSVMALGIVSFLLRSSWPGPVIVILGNSMVVAGHFLLNIAFATFVRRPPPWHIFLAASLIALAGTAYWTLVDPDARARLVLVSGGIVLSCALIMRDLLTGRAPLRTIQQGRQIARLTLAGAYGLHLCINLAHIALLFGGPELPAFLTGGELRKTWIVWDTAVLFLFPVGIVLLTSERLLDQLDRLASHDELTGLLNRRAFNQRLAEEHSRARRARQPIAVLMLDIDHFKALNDNYGHGAGDAMLQAVTGTIGGLLRREDIFARLGGDEFCILLPGTSGAGAMRVAERVRTAMAALRVPYGKVELQQTLSIGVAIIGMAESDPAVALQAADAALYRAKDRGRNATVMAECLVPPQAVPPLTAPAAQPMSAPPVA